MFLCYIIMYNSYFKVIIIKILRPHSQKLKHAKSDTALPKML